MNCYTESNSPTTLDKFFLSNNEKYKSKRKANIYMIYYNCEHTIFHLIILHVFLLYSLKITFRLSSNREKVLSHFKILSKIMVVLSSLNYHILVLKEHIFFNRIDQNSKYISSTFSLLRYTNRFT